MQKGMNYMLKFIGYFAGLILAIVILSAIPVVGTILAYLLLAAIVVIIVVNIVRSFWDILSTIFVLLPHFLIWGVVALVLAFLFWWLY